MEGGTFHTPQLSAVLRHNVVESRLHMDYPGRIAADKYAVHERLLDELIGKYSWPYYAILDPRTDATLPNAGKRETERPLRAMIPR